MDDPTAIATRYATITRKMVHDATQVAIDAFNKINGSPGKYKGKDAIKAMTQLADIAITGGAALARIPLQIQPDNGPMLVADEVASVVQTALTDVAKIAGVAAQKIDAGKFKDKWVDSAIMLTSVAVLRTAEAAEAIVAGPGVLANPVMEFGPFTVTGATLADEVVLKVEKLARPGVDENIAGLVNFTPAGGVLKAGTTKAFSFTINSAGIASGMFEAEISVSINNGAPSTLAPPVIVNL
ncbi:hypothetical protein [Mycobacterium sp.]|uniref:hypothetical protein n=1 Tax=Mycobacterium sp. TaxID=1785 RepID=UPI003F9772B8